MWSFHLAFLPFTSRFFPTHSLFICLLSIVHIDTRTLPAQQMTQSVFQRMHIPRMLENMLWYFISEVEYTQCYIGFDRQTNRSKLVSGWKLWKFPWAYHHRHCHRHRHQYTILSKIDLFSWNNVILLSMFCRGCLDLIFSVKYAPTIWI